MQGLYNEIDSKSIVLKENQTDSSNSAVSNSQPVASADTDTDTGTVSFLVQIATSSTKTEIKPENFKGIKDIVELFSNERYKYAAGRFEDYGAAVKYRKKLESLYPDAFVIAVKKNKILPLQQALEQKKKK